jgi:hypothetical protein
MSNAHSNYRRFFSFWPLLLVGVGVLFLLRNLGVLSAYGLGWWFSGAWLGLVYIGLLQSASVNSAAQSRSQPLARASSCACQRCRTRRFRYVCMVFTAGLAFLLSLLPSYFDIFASDQIAVVIIGMICLFLFASLHASTEGHVQPSEIPGPSAQASAKFQQNNLQVRS